MAHGGEHIEFFSLGKAYKKILTVLELQVHPPKLEALIEKLVDYSGESPSPRIFQRALAVADMAQLSMLHEGRSEASLAVACVVLAIESQTAKKMEAKVLEDLSEERSTTKSQVMKRYKEFRQVLLDYGSSLPFFKDLEKKNFLRILGSLLDFGHEHGWRRGADPAEGEEEEQTLEQKRLPPAFVKSAQNSRITIDRIQRVKERLFKDMHPMLAPNSASGDLAFEPEAILAMDDRDEMIAQYLLDGFSDQEILDFNPVFRRTKKK